MMHSSGELAIPEDSRTPTQLPAEFASCVDVREIIDSEYPGYVYLESAYILTECVDCSVYHVMPCDRLRRTHDVVNEE